MNEQMAMRFRAVGDAVPAPMLLLDLDGVVLETNSAAVPVIGAPSQVVGRAVWDVMAVVGDDRRSRRPLMSAEGFALLLEHGLWRHDDVMLNDASGRWTPADVRATMLGSGADARGAVVFIADNSYREQVKARAAWDSNHDSLTNLPNRAFIAHRLAAAIETSLDDGSAALLHVSVDRFSAVNDTFGTAAGDELLIAVADRLAGCLRPGDVAARLGGDVFLVLAELIPAPVSHALAERVRRAMAEPFVLAGEQVFVSASVGLTSIEPACEPDRAMREANDAALLAKMRGGNRVEVFGPEHRRRLERRDAVERALRRALRDRELSVVYQPLVRVAGGTLAAFEALARWTDPDLGVVAPDEFIPLAEQLGLTVPFGEWELDIVCRDAASWTEACGTPLAVHLNITSRQLGAPSLDAAVTGALTRHRLDPSMLVLEMNERVVMDDPEVALRRLRDVSRLGVRLAIDNFGTGFSSLNYLRRFPLHMVKLDRELVAKLPGSDMDCRVVRNLLDLANDLGYEVVAEGVENDLELEAIRTLGCGLAQGWLFGKPLSAPEALLTAAAAATRVV